MPSKLAVGIGTAVIGVIAVVTVAVTQPDGSVVSTPTTITIPVDPPTDTVTIDPTVTTTPPATTPPPTTTPPATTTTVPPVTTTTTTVPPVTTTTPTTTTTPPAAGAWPGRHNTGVPAGWTPATTRTGNYTITTPGAVIQDLRVTNGNIIINAPNVTLRRVEVVNGRIINYSNGCQANLLIEDTSILRTTGANAEEAINAGSYTARRVKIDGWPEGFRVGGRPEGCGPVLIEDSFVSTKYPEPCGDWHGDGIQGYNGNNLVIKRTTLEMIEKPDCGGTAPFFWPDQGNGRADVDGLLVIGGGFSFRLGTPATVKNLMVKDGSWTFGPRDVTCSKVTSWQASIVTIDTNYQPTVVRPLTCS